jgi:hypothetical protein
MPSGAAVTVYEGKHGRTFRVKYRDVSGRGRPRRARVRGARGRGGLRHVEPRWCSGCSSRRVVPEPAKPRLSTVEKSR